ncbi:MAG: terminase family protein [Myxococcota bacterium]
MVSLSSKELRKAAAREIQRRRAARTSLLSFAEYTHPRWQTGEHHKLICAALEELAARRTRRLIIEAPPRHTKSELTSVRLPAWWLGRNPTEQIIATSYSAELANDFGYQVRNLVADPTYNRVFPGVTLAKDDKAKGRWRTSEGGVYVSAGVGGSITGKGAHLAIIDDPFKSRAEADSPVFREKVWRFFNSDLQTRLMPDGVIVVMATRWHEDDLIGRILDRLDGWERLRLPAIRDEGTDAESALWPEWYPLERLHEIRKNYSDAALMREWFSLYQQDPRPSEGDYMRREWFEGNRWTGDKDSLPPLKIYITSDFAVTLPEEGRDPDWTVHGVFGVDDEDNLWVLDLWRGRTTSEVWIEALLDLHAKWGALAYFGEAGVIRRAIEPALRKRIRERRVYLPVTDDSWVASIRDKAIRGQSFRARAALGKVWFPADAEWASAAIEEIVGFPGATHDDIFDVFSLMCLAIDRAWGPAKQTPEENKEPRDRYRWKTVGAQRTSADSWKTV